MPWASKQKSPILIEAATSGCQGCLMETTIHGASVRGVGSSNLPVPTIPTLQSIETYLNGLLLLRKPSTENRSRQILLEAMPFLTEPDPAPGAKAYLVWCKGQGNCQRTLANKLVRLKAFYRTLGVKLDIPQPSFVQRKPEVYGSVDLDRFLAACTASQRLLFETLLYGGLRMQEAMYLTWDDVEPNLIHVRAKDDWSTKTGGERVIPVPRTLTDRLFAARRGDAALVFPTARGNPDGHMLRTCKRVAKRAGLDPKKWSLHGFRRTCLTKLVNGGFGLPTAMAVAGHRDTKSAMRYQRPLEGKTLQDKIEALWVS